MSWYREKCSNWYRLCVHREFSAFPRSGGVSTLKVGWPFNCRVVNIFEVLYKIDVFLISTLTFSLEK